MTLEMNRLTRIERKLMSAEYWLDSTNTHVRRVKCHDVKPLALSRYSKSLNAVRAAIAMIRNEQGARHPTLFAGKAGRGKANIDRGQKQKAWGTDRPHKWRKDCAEERRIAGDFSAAISQDKEGPLPHRIEVGLSASCWHCDGVFTKVDYCEICGFYRCPHCRGCACAFTAEVRAILRKTVLAMAGRR